ncbi:hypothetical protein CASFOL_036624 [Castilleja foliolosa]|uniref:RNase H type-1 domain-containing protein n=1 Tax=Castilleja foliolosa TaxID=1961234 RepID=A0ABD3BQR3_9LAMI
MVGKGICFHSPFISFRLRLRLPSTNQTAPNTQLNPKKAHSTWDRIILEKLRIPAKAPNICKSAWYGWSKPEKGNYKLNIDGSFKNDRGTTGGCIRDFDGKPILTFWCKLGTSNPNSTETAAILKGWEIAQQLQLINLRIESDSRNAIDTIKGNGFDPESIYIARNFHGDKDQIHHIYREQNLVAHSLAAIAHLESDKIITDPIELPHTVKTLLLQDKMGLKQRRKRKNPPQECAHI